MEDGKKEEGRKDKGRGKKGKGNFKLGTDFRWSGGAR
jgi:hypothetical protein